MFRPPRSIRLLLASFVIALVAAACSDSDGSSTSTSESVASSTVATTSSTDPMLPTTAPTTSAAPTTVPTSTTTTSTAPTETTTAQEPRPGGLVLLADGLGPLEFGVSPDAAIEFLSAALGTPMADSGWTDSFSVYGTCPGTEVRGVEWPGFLALFGDADDAYSSGGQRHFMAWTVGWFGPDPFGMQTLDGIGVGDSRDDVANTYLSAVFNAASDPFPASVDITTDRGDLYGTFDVDARLLTSLSAGTACGE